MKHRCYNSDDKDAKHYKERGITVCDTWLSSPLNFVEDMGNRPTKNHTLERIDNNGNYCKDNCKWALLSEQSRNKSNNVMLSYNGLTQCLKDWADGVRIDYRTLSRRLSLEWSTEKTLLTPVGKQGTKLQNVGVYHCG